MQFFTALNRCALSSGSPVATVIHRPNYVNIVIIIMVISIIIRDSFSCAHILQLRTTFMTVTWNKCNQ